MPIENWGVRGGIPADELDLGFKVNVLKNKIGLQVFANNE